MTPRQKKLPTARTAPSLIRVLNKSDLSSRARRVTSPKTNLTRDDRRPAGQEGITELKCHSSTPVWGMPVRQRPQRKRTTRELLNGRRHA